MLLHNKAHIRPNTVILLLLLTLLQETSRYLHKTQKILHHHQIHFRGPLHFSSTYKSSFILLLQISLASFRELDRC